VSSEDVEDQLCAVDYSGFDCFLNVALLRSTEVVIEKNQIG
jgi:hypothetical protein